MVMHEMNANRTIPLVVMGLQTVPNLADTPQAPELGNAVRVHPQGVPFGIGVR